MGSMPPRKVPRIMSRVKPRYEVKCEPSTSGLSDLNDALVRELIPETFVVRNGVVIGVQTDSRTGDFSSAAQVFGASQRLPDNFLRRSSPGAGRRFVIDTTPLVSDFEPYSENRLPGVADEVESYPCKFCPDQVFLTSLGLESHAMQCHNNDLDELIEHINYIKEEWRRRTRDRSKLRERMQIAKQRHTSIATVAANSNVLQSMPPGSTVEVNATDIPSLVDDRFEACRVCRTLINTRMPNAMESHLRAHRKNDELRAQMCAQFGADFVRRLTCTECQLVFTTDVKLQFHIECSHARKRKFVCKWCGHLCTSLAALNVHKNDVHGIPNIQKANVRFSINSSAPTKNMSSRTSVSEDSLFTTTCEVCGLLLTRPGLLIRHMQRVHMRDTFNCVVNPSSKDLPKFRVSVSHMTVTYNCCELSFNDRNDFISHRRDVHIQKLKEADVINVKKQGDNPSNEKFLELENEGFAIEPGATTFTAEAQVVNGTVQVAIPDGVEVDPSGQIYVLLMDDNENDTEHKEQVAEIEVSSQYEEQPMHQPILEVDGNGITAEQYEELRAQFGDNMQFLAVNEDGTVALSDIPIMVHHNVEEQQQPTPSQEQLPEQAQQIIRPPPPLSTKKQPKLEPPLEELFEP